MRREAELLRHESEPEALRLLRTIDGLGLPLTAIEPLSG